MDNYFEQNQKSRNVTVKSLPLEYSSELQRCDQLGILDANYHGSADLLLKKCSRNWFTMDVFALDRFLESPLISYCLHLFCDVWSLNQSISGEPPLIRDIVQLVRLARTISEKYSCTNYYHTILHGMDVAHSFSCLLQSGQEKRLVTLDRHEILVALLSALMHDIDHPGVTYDYFYDKDIENFFKSKNMASNESPLLDEANLTSYKQRQMMKSRSKRYLHSLESHQANFAISVLLGSGLISDQTEERQRQLCRLMTDLIESTDMHLHRSVSTGIGQLLETIEKSPNDLLPADRLLILCFMLKCSDTSNPSKQWDYYFTWSHLITSEFFAQGDKERYIRGCLNANKFVTHFCDRQLVKFELSQIGFIKFVRESFHQLDCVLQCRLTRAIIIQLERNLKRLLMIHDMKRFTSTVDAKNPVKLRVTVMMRGPNDAEPPANKLKFCLLLCNWERSIRGSMRTSMRSSMFGDKIPHIF